jgi:hypothetical protein
MSFSDTPEAVQAELARNLRQCPPVVCADALDADDAPSGDPELDVVCRATDRGTLPNCVTLAILQSSLGIAAVREANAIGHKQVVIR